MADLTYTIYSGELVTRSANGKLVVAFTESGFSNYWWDSAQIERGKHGKPGHVEGGPIPPGRWRVHPPGSKHPDGGKLRPDWIPVGPVLGRSLIYIHCEGRTEGCINIPKHTAGNRQRFEAIKHIVAEDKGGWLTVLSGGVA